MYKKTAYSERYTGRYRGILYILENNEPSRIWQWWCGYIVIVPENVPAENLPDFFPAPVLSGEVYHYPESPLIAELPMHGGCTFFEIEQRLHPGKGLLKSSKLGWDYNHYTDVPCRYSMEYVLRDAKLCIDALHDAIRILVWCDDYGGFQPESEIHYNEDKSKAYNGSRQ